MGPMMNLFTPEPTSQGGKSNETRSIHKTHRYLHKACLARIPKGGSSGQRMLAKQSCNQDEGTRKASQDAPKF